MPFTDNCYLLLSTASFNLMGTNTLPTCYLDPVTYDKIYINLGAQNTVTVGSAITFNANVLQDRSPSCAGTFITTVVTNTVLAPVN